ncbi:MAG TPA: glycoside hydrolase family 3 N-terminal domain-containing protein [Terrimicrobiaceae bacterium]
MTSPTDPVNLLEIEETAPSCCGRTFMVSGKIQHYKTPADITVAGGDAAVFAEEVYGRSFRATVPWLPEGSYTVEIDLAEVLHREAGSRIIDIACGDTKLAEDLDILEAAGGFARALRVTGEVEHLGDALRGPLTIVFKAKIGDAKFHAIHLRDASGATVASIKAKDLVDTDLPGAAVVPDIIEPPVYMDPDLPIDERVADLVRRMSLKEKVGQMQDQAPSIERLGVPAYGYWNEALHGVGRAGVATVFPQAIGMAATWDVELIRSVADVIATEARAKYNAITGDHPRYHGLNFWTPNINIFRDPRWGRGQETYGEDPFLTARMAVAFIKGLQGDDPRYLKAMACAKHFAVHSGPEAPRHHFNASPPERDLYETYLPHFEAAVREAHVWSVMGAYNRLYGEPACSSTFLLEDLLRKKWGFKGHVVSDCGAITDIWQQHKAASTMEDAAARALKAGCDLECGNDYRALVAAVNAGLVSEKEIDNALGRIFEARFRLGMFDPPNRVPYAKIPPSKNDCTEHGELALRAARESIVLLKNDGILPLDKAKLERIAVIGANAASVEMLLGNYNGTPSRPVTVLEGIKSEVGGSADVVYSQGAPLALKPGESFGPDTPAFQEALRVARSASVVVYVGGLSPVLEGEEMRVDYEGFKGGDRTRIELPSPQTAFLEALHAVSKAIVFVNCSGSATAMPLEAKNLSAMIQAWYPGQAGGTAVADVLFGRINPAGRLPITFYNSTEDLPDFADYAMSGRTYRYFRGRTLFPFGHGLSYTSFTYGPIDVAIDENAAAIRTRLAISNTGHRDGDEVVQIYVRHLEPRESPTNRSLAGFKRISLRKGESRIVEIKIPKKCLRVWDIQRKDYVLEPGDYEIEAGSSSEDIRTRTITTIAR